MIMVLERRTLVHLTAHSMFKKLVVVLLRYLVTYTFNAERIFSVRRCHLIIHIAYNEYLTQQERDSVHSSGNIFNFWLQFAVHWELPMKTTLRNM